jgi:hypothetical protein
MSFVDTKPPPASRRPSLPELPEGWRYTDELPWDDSSSSLTNKRRLLLFVAAGVALAALVIGLIVLNAQIHYARGAAALQSGAYDLAATELSQASLLVLPYRDATALADEARRDLAVQAAARRDAQTRFHAVAGAFTVADAALESGRVSAALAALGSVPVSDLRNVMREDAAVGDAAEALTRDLTAAATAALGQLQWGRAADCASALMLLDPSSKEAAELVDRATTGRRLSARLAKAQQAARRSQWKTALRLALGVTAVRKDFPGASAVIAKARKALAPKPLPAPAATTPSAPATTAGTTTSGTTGGSSSGSTSTPPPP